jgi:hypothetical protein
MVNVYLVSFKDLLALTKTDLEEIVIVICKPGGAIPNPASKPNFPVPGVPPHLPENKKKKKKTRKDDRINKRSDGLGSPSDFI